MIKGFLEEVKDAIDRINPDDIQCVVDILECVRGNGRLFIVGSGGGAGHASHAVCDFRKLCGIESYSPYDNITELTARVNDEGWDTTITAWLAVSNFNEKDCLLVVSVGGGSPNISGNIHSAIIYAKNIGAKIIGVIGREKCTTTEYADASIVIKSKFMTPIVEGLQSVILHLLVTKLAINKTVW